MTSLWGLDLTRRPAGRVELVEREVREEDVDGAWLAVTASGVAGIPVEVMPGGHVGRRRSGARRHPGPPAVVELGPVAAEGFVDTGACATEAVDA